MMKMILTTLLLLAASGADATMLKASTPAELSETIQRLYDESRTPYPLEEQVSQSFNHPSFSGCAQVFENDELVILEDTYIVKYKLVLSPAAGPLKPEVSRSVFMLTDRSWVSKLTNLRYFFHGIVNVAFTLNEMQMPVCPESNGGTTVRDFVTNSSSELTQSENYVTSIVCNNRGLLARYWMRKSGNFLVSRIYQNYKHGWMYCWK